MRGASLPMSDTGIAPVPFVARTGRTCGTSQVSCGGQCRVVWRRAGGVITYTDSAADRFSIVKLCFPSPCDPEEIGLAGKSVELRERKSAKYRIYALPCSGPSSALIKVGPS
jgi:hypothetical protein